MPDRVVWSERVLSIHSCSVCGGDDPGCRNCYLLGVERGSARETSPLPRTASLGVRLLESLVRA